VLDGDLALSFKVPTFTPAGDPRELGVIILRVTVRPADYGLRPFVIPAPGTLLGLSGWLVGAYFLVLVCGFGRSIALVSTLVLSALATLGLLVARADMALLAAQSLSLVGWALPMAAIARVALTGMLTPVATSTRMRAGSATAWGALAFTIAFLVRFGGLTYPQFLTSDLLLHVHNAQDVVSGAWVFTEPLPDGRDVPYPPAYYLLIATLALFTGTSDEGVGLALKWTSSLLDALTCLGLVWAAWRLWPQRGYAAGATAALAYAASPGALDLFSAGNYTNLFGQSVLNLTLLGGLVYVAGHGARSPGAVVLLGLGFFLTMLGHYGMMLATLGIMAIFALSTVSLRSLSVEAGSAWRLLGAFGAALGAGVALYYWRFLDVIGAQFGALFGRLGGQGSGSGITGATGLLDSLLKLPEKIAQLSGGFLVIGAAFGSALLARRPRAVSLLLLSWLVATFVFALLDRVVGDSIRWYYLGAAPIALLAGRFLALLLERGAWSRTLVVLTLMLALLQMLEFWIDLIYTRYH
jgi:hypothetical protein